MNDAEYMAECLTNFRNEVELPKGEQRDRLLRDLELAQLAEGHDRRPRSQAWLRPALRRLGQQMIAAGEWLAQHDGDLASPGM